MKDVSIITNLSIKEVENKFIYTFNYKRFETVEFIRLKDSYLLRNRRERDPFTKMKLIDLFDFFGIDIDLIPYKINTAIHVRLRTNIYFNLLFILLLLPIWLVAIVVVTYASFPSILIYLCIAGFISLYFIFRAHKSSQQHVRTVQKISQIFPPYTELYLHTKAFDELLMN
jgi:hypothetical protein